ncbi:UNVERIFIED_CONTAM: hypothetical protein Sangu_0392800 [Sesamum angustifolium]|uniref:Uncharacterized protein n=1 Tax=Sesamum angustifolium TaxID=2727405 RepID=A0AAW2QSP3_9LAMI
MTHIKKLEQDLLNLQRHIFGVPLNWKEPNLLEYEGTTNSQEHLSCFENVALLHRYSWG